MDQAHVKGFLKKYKDEEPFKIVYDKIEAEFNGKFPCCQPLDKKYCAWFFEILWENPSSREKISKNWHGTVEYKIDGILRRIFL